MATQANETTIHGLAAGGRGVGRLADGCTVFVAGTVPGDRVSLHITKRKKRFAEADVAELFEPGEHRVPAPCPEVAAGCGGCDWQHVATPAQADAKATLVRDALQRIGSLSPDLVTPTISAPSEHYRTTVRAGVDSAGRAGFRRRATNDVHAVTNCLVTHPLVDELLHDGRFSGSNEVVIRASVATGERIVVVDAHPPHGSVPDDVVVVTRSELAAGKRVWVSETVAGRAWRVSAEAFFQPGPAGAELLVAEVQRCLDGLQQDLTSGTLLDAYAGVGILGGSATTGAITAIETNPSGAADARVNLADHDARVLQEDLANWHPTRAVAAIADPPRSGMTDAALARLTRSRAQRIVLVSCDPPTMARDAGRLTERGYDLAHATPVDQFGHTSHVEVVARFDRR